MPVIRSATARPAKASTPAALFANAAKATWPSSRATLSSSIFLRPAAMRLPSMSDRSSISCSCLTCTQLVFTHFRACARSASVVALACLRTFARLAAVVKVAISASTAAAQALFVSSSFSACRSLCASSTASLMSASMKMLSAAMPFASSEICPAVVPSGFFMVKDVARSWACTSPPAKWAVSAAFSASLSWRTAGTRTPLRPSLPMYSDAAIWSASLPLPPLTTSVLPPKSTKQVFLSEPPLSARLSTTPWVSVASTWKGSPGTIGAGPCTTGAGTSLPISANTVLLRGSGSGTCILLISAKTFLRRGVRLCSTSPGL